MARERDDVACEGRDDDDLHEVLGMGSEDGVRHGRVLGVVVKGVNAPEEGDLKRGEGASAKARSSRAEQHSGGSSSGGAVRVAARRMGAVQVKELTS